MPRPRVFDYFRTEVVLIPDLQHLFQNRIDGRIRHQIQLHDTIKPFRTLFSIPVWKVRRYVAPSDQAVVMNKSEKKLIFL
jgi:hypothetical protein